MTSLARLAVSIIAICSASSAFAAVPSTNHYISLSYYQNSTEFATGAGTIVSDVDNIAFRYGYKIFNFLAVEGVAGFSAEKTGEDNATSVENDYLFGVFARANWDLPALKTSVYGLAGLSRAKNTYTDSGDSLNPSASYSTTATGASLGAGVELFGAPTTALHLEWVRYLNTGDLVSEGWVLGLTHHFAMAGWR